MARIRNASQIPLTITVEDLELLREEAQEGWKSADEKLDEYLAVMHEYHKTGRVKEWDDNREQWDLPPLDMTAPKA